MTCKQVVHRIFAFVIWWLTLQKMAKYKAVTKVKIHVSTKHKYLTRAQFLHMLMHMHVTHKHNTKW